MLVAFWVTGASVIKDAECVKRKKNESLTILHALHRTSGEERGEGTIGETLGAKRMSSKERERERRKKAAQKYHPLT